MFSILTHDLSSCVGGLDVYYPNYNVNWNDGHCINTRPLPSGVSLYWLIYVINRITCHAHNFSYPHLLFIQQRPTYTDMLSCCKQAYAGQTSNKCISMLPIDIRPTTSPTNSERTADFFYPMYEMPWSTSGCSNKLPLPYNNVNDRPNYSTGEECCNKAYGGQSSMACLCEHLDTPQLGCDGIIEYELTTITTVVTSTLTLGDIDIPTNADEKAALVETLEDMIFDMLLDKLGGDLQEVRILSIGGDAVRRSLRYSDERLLTTSADIEYEVIVENTCTGEDCTSKSVEDQVVNEVLTTTSNTEDIQNAIQSSNNAALASVTVQSITVDQTAVSTTSSETIVGVSFPVYHMLKSRVFL